ncbi:hypothetical protein STBHUCCB_41600 [Salmonella enterica subsp. enterica serovar Typhi str. P-stx-12]|nr:hypothetical protein STBHUCCB_41600 [Salmonella enterica subsp. enterica serovar Typhi str. P-stx-12]
MRVSFPARNADDDNITTRFHSIFVIHFLRGARCLNARSMAIVFHSFLSRMETPAERTPGGLCDTHG